MCVGTRHFKVVPLFSTRVCVVRGRKRRGVWEEGERRDEGRREGTTVVHVDYTSFLRERCMSTQGLRTFLFVRRFWFVVVSAIELPLCVRRDSSFR